MITIALIGNDGSGKSTLAKRLLADAPLPMKYIYMGNSIQSSNYALPWTRLALWVKQQNIRRHAQQENITDPTYLTTHHIDHRRKETGNIRTFFRVLNRLIEAIYRFLIARIFLVRGYHVLFDRYFLFEAAPVVHNGIPQPMNPIEYAYYRLWRDMIPHPDITIFLDAPADILIARKEEGTVEYFELHQASWLHVGEKMENFFVVDASQPVDIVYRNVQELIVTRLEQRESQIGEVVDV